MSWLSHIPAAHQCQNGSIRSASRMNWDSLSILGSNISAWSWAFINANLASDA